MTYEEMIRLTMQSAIHYCCIVLTIAAVLLALHLLKWIIWKKRPTKKVGIGIGMLLFALTLLACWQIFPAALDIAGTDYIIVEGTIKKFSGTGTTGNGVYHGGAYIVTEDGEEIQIQFAPGISRGFPNGEFYATVVYSKRTHYLLDIYPNMTIEEALSTSDILKEYKDDLIYYEQGA